MTAERCAVHPKRRSTATCPRCGSFACAKCWDAGAALCTVCVAGGHATEVVPWESDEGGFLETVRRVWRTPTRFFRRLPDGERSDARAFVFWCLALAALPVVVGTLVYDLGLGGASILHALVQTILGGLVTPWAFALAVWLPARLLGTAATRDGVYRACAYAHAYVLPFHVVLAVTGLAMIEGGLDAGIALVAMRSAAGATALLAARGVALYLEGRGKMAPWRAWIAALVPVASMSVLVVLVVRGLDLP